MDISKISLSPLATLPIHFLFTLLDSQPAPRFPVSIFTDFLPAGVGLGEEVLYFNCSKFTTSKLQVVPLHSDALGLPNHLCSLPALAFPHQRVSQMLCPARSSGNSSLWPPSLTRPCTPCWFTPRALPLLRLPAHPLHSSWSDLLETETMSPCSPNPGGKHMAQFTCDTLSNY